MYKQFKINNDYHGIKLNSVYTKEYKPYKPIFIPKYGIKIEFVKKKEEKQERTIITPASVCQNIWLNNLKTCIFMKKI